jgi:hypothetical protein
VKEVLFHGVKKEEGEEKPGEEDLKWRLGR